MTRRLLLALAAAALAFAPAAFAADIAAGKAAAAVCAACHGADGNTPIADYPRLAGQRKDYMLYVMRAYKNGKRPNAVMSAQMAALSDSDLQNLAAYYASLPGNLR
jgi:cytochrome c553